MDSPIPQYSFFIATSYLSSKHCSDITISRKLFLIYLSTSRSDLVPFSVFLYQNTYDSTVLDYEVPKNGNLFNNPFLAFNIMSRIEEAFNQYIFKKKGKEVRKEDG